MAGQIEIIITDEFRAAYKKLPDDIKKKVKKQLRFLSSNPTHPSLKIHRLNDEWEFYVDIHYRGFFLRKAGAFILLTVGSHRIVDRYKRN